MKLSTLKLFKNKWYSLSFTLVLIYISYINIFILRSTPEIIFIQFGIILFAYNKKGGKIFLKDWLPFISLFLLFEFLRGYIDDLSPFYDQVLYWCYYIEVFLFHKLPSIVLQEKFSSNETILYLSIFFYLTFFYYSFLIAFLIWLKKPTLFKEYMKSFLILTYLGLLVHFLLPTAPPWMVSEAQNLGIKRLLYYKIDEINPGWLSIYKYFIMGNPVAAMPSLHIAWPAFTSLFIIKKLKNKLAYLLLIIPFAIGFSVVFTGEHYVIDVIAGFLLTFFLINSQKIKKQKSISHY